MTFLEFKDKGFEEAVKKTLNTSKEKLAIDDLPSIEGIFIADGDYNGMEVPWQADSSAFDMNYPNFWFNTQKSSNGKWESDLQYFSHIKSLHLHQSTGNLDFLKNFSNLEELYVSNNRATDWSFLLELTNIRSLSLNNCNFSDLTVLKDLCSEQQNIRKEIGDDFGFWKYSLQNVGLKYCSISDLSPLADCHSISDLDLSHNEISDISPLVNIRSLYYLTLRYNNISDITPFKDLKGVYYLNMRHNQITDISALAHLKNFDLTRLFLGDNKITNFEPINKLNLLQTDIEGYKKRY